MKRIHSSTCDTCGTNEGMQALVDEMFQIAESETIIF